MTIFNFEKTQSNLDQFTFFFQVQTEKSEHQISASRDQQ